MTTRTGKYEDNVFINCPFDQEYRPIFNALIFAIYDAGFVVRCAKESSDSGTTRLNKIIGIIRDCKYGIHDISRTEIGTSQLPRFNMPFECGLFWGCREFGSEGCNDKYLLVLDSERFRYQEALSDIAGQDIESHKNDPRQAVSAVRSWLRTNSKRRNIPGGEEIWRRYSEFQKNLPAMLKAARITRKEFERPEYYTDYTNFITKWLDAVQAA